MPSRTIPIPEVVAQLHALGVAPGDVLMVHTSFRRVRPIDGGPVGLIEALRRCLGPHGTLVMPSWTGDDESPFDPATTPPDPDLGVVAGTFWRLPGVLRSDHAFAFAAEGAKAAAILADGMVLPPHQPESPIGRVLAHDGRILLLGVGHDANTALHLAELMAGVPYRRKKHITVLRDGRPTRIDYQENDHCCERFDQAGAWLAAAGLQREGPVGHAPSTLMRCRDVIETALAKLRSDPFVFLHPQGSGCEACDDAWDSTAGYRGAGLCSPAR